MSGKRCLFSTKASLYRGVKLPAALRLVTFVLALLVDARPALADDAGAASGDPDYVSPDDWNATAYDDMFRVPPIPSDYKPVQCPVCEVLLEAVRERAGSLPEGSQPYCQAYGQPMACMDKYSCKTHADLRSKVRAKCPNQRASTSDESEGDDNSPCGDCTRRLLATLKTVNSKSLNPGGVEFCKTLASPLTCLQVKQCVTTGMLGQIRTDVQMYCSRRMDACGLCLLSVKNAISGVQNVSLQHVEQFCAHYFAAQHCLEQRSCEAKPESGSDVLLMQEKCSMTRAFEAVHNVAQRVVPMAGSPAPAFFLTVVAAVTVFILQ